MNPVNTLYPIAYMQNKTEEPADTEKLRHC